MSEAIKQFVEKYNGASVDYDKRYGAQCVDLFNFYNSEVVGAPFIGTPVSGGARDLYEVDSPVRSQFYKKLPADSQFQAGDVLIYGEPQGRAIVNNKTIYYGHCNIYIGDGLVIQQNAKWNQLTTVDPVFKTGLIGILRPLKFIGQNSPQNVEPTTQNKNKHIISQGDTFWGLEERNGWQHGTLEQLNPGIDPRKLAIGTAITIPDDKSTAHSAAEEYYIVQSGDTFWDLENAWQLSHGTLQRLNPELNPRELKIGQRIKKS